MLSSIPVALLVTGFISISGRLVRYSMFAGVVACTIWGAALGYTFSTSETLSRLVDPGGYFLCLEFWMIFILLHCMMTLIILGVANAIFSVRRS